MFIELIRALASSLAGCFDCRHFETEPEIERPAGTDGHVSRVVVPALNKPSTQWFGRAKRGGGGKARSTTLPGKFLAVQSSTNGRMINTWLLQA